MSQSLVIFAPSGSVLYKYNNKLSPFNDFISEIVNGTCTELEPDFFTSTINQKRLYCLKRKNTYAAIYFDAVSTLDSDKIKSCLVDVLKIYLKVTEEELSDRSEKLQKLIDYQFNQLMKLLQAAKVAQSLESGPESKTNSGTSTPKKVQSQTKKTMRKWDGNQMVEVNANEVLDYSEGKAGDDSAINTDSLVSGDAFSQQDDLVLVNELNDILDEDVPSDEVSKKSGFFGKISSYFGGPIDLDEVSKTFTDQFISKNIAPATAKTITDKLNHELKGKKITLKDYKRALTVELTKILTPNVSTDLLYDVKRNSSTSNSRPYVISVVGVNGVGKSTNLAKLAYWFLQNNLNVLICACDTFRSGAVEQLKVHVNNLKRLNTTTNTKIDIFEKGYGGGDHVVATAKLAIEFAGAEGFDIVLIDTAGRTHSNAKLMAPLKKFGDAANPNKIIMVGEALVGTDSVEQAVNFNNAFGNRRSLDFFIISKVDTVGDLVGSMINMVMATKVPILFVGTGQVYTDIKRLSVKSVVDALMR